MTDILASWSSLFSVCTVLRAESISRGPQASWAFRKTQVLHTHTCTLCSGMRMEMRIYVLPLNASKNKNVITKVPNTFWVAVLSSARQVARFLAHWPSCIAAAWSATVGAADFADVTILLPG